MTHPRYGTSHVNPRCSDGSPEPDGSLKVVVRKKIIHYHQLYIDRPDPIAFMPVAVDTSDRIYDDFLRLLFLYTHRESSAERTTYRRKGLTLPLQYVIDPTKCTQQYQADLMEWDREIQWQMVKKTNHDGNSNPHSGDFGKIKSTESLRF